MSAHDSVRLLADTSMPARLDPDGGHLRDVWRIALPLICSSSAHAVKLFSDRAMVGWYSSTMLSASFLAGLLAAVFVVAVIATGQYTGTFVAQYMGAGRRDRVGLAVWQGILFSLAGGVVLSFLGLFGTDLLDYTGHEPVLLAGEKSYFMVTLCMAGFSIGAASIASFWTGRGKPWMATVVTVISLFLNVVFNWIFIFGTDGCQRLANTAGLRHFGDALNGISRVTADFLAPYASADFGGLADGPLAPVGGALHWFATHWGVEPMGIYGAALATGLTEALTFLIFLVLFLRKPHRREFGTWPKRVFEFDLMKRLLRFGTPSGAQPFVDILTFFCFNFLIAQYGEAEAHAAAIAFSVNTLAFNPMLGMGAAATILVGQAVGGRHIPLARRVVRSTRKMIVVYVAAMATIFLAAPDKIIDFFAEDRKPAAEASSDSAAAPASTLGADADAEAAAWTEGAAAPDAAEDAAAKAEEEKDTRRLARKFLVFIAFWLIGDGFFILYSSAIRGAGDTHFAMKMIMMMSVFLYALPCVVIHEINRRHFDFAWGPDPLWFMMVAYVIVSGLLFYWRYRHGAWEKMRVIEG